jgi:predicted RNA binding protein YcfA (HicA-like mRNA interferase family)
VTRQTGSHMRLTTSQGGEHHVTIPRHKSLRVGTLSAILRDVTEHLDMPRQTLLEALFGE